MGKYATNLIGTYDRESRKIIAKLEAKAKRTGDWGPWERFETPNGAPGGKGWTRSIRWVMKNNLYVILCRPLQTEIGEVIHCAIRTASQYEPPWRDKQRIKNECFGEDRIAVEVMPATDRLIDAADMYHIWIMPYAYQMPFCLYDAEQRTLD